MQTGQGLFGNFVRFIVPAVKSLGRTVAPVAKSFVKNAPKDLLTAGARTSMEYLEGHDPAESAKRNLKRAAAHTLKTTVNNYSNNMNKSLNTKSLRGRKKRKMNISPHAY